MTTDVYIWSGRVRQELLGRLGDGARVRFASLKDWARAGKLGLGTALRTVRDQ